jgi:UPF0271 protein
MFRIDLNSDLGESFGPWKMGRDGEVMKNITSANVACGFHAGDPMVMAETVRMAMESGVAVGAHPGYPDLQGFGRRKMICSPDEIYSDCLYQIGALSAFCQARGTELQHVKAHGALYNTAANDIELASAIARAVKDGGKDLILMGLANSIFEKAAQDMGVPFASEAFADRAYNEDGTLVSRKKEGSVIHDSRKAAERVVRMVKEGTVETFTGKVITLKPHSICLHGDTPEAVEMSAFIRKTLMEEGIQVVPLREIVLG